MGNLSSKQPPGVSISTEAHQDNYLPSTIDPRSPTLDILRTPLKVTPTKLQGITKNIDLNKVLHNYDYNTVNKSYGGNSIFSAVMRNHLQEFDPRSPTVDFERTPIIISKTSTVDKSTAPVSKVEPDQSMSYVSINDSNCEIDQLTTVPIARNLVNGFANVSLDDSNKIAEACNHENSQSHNDSLQKKQFLETNFDFDESQTENINEGSYADKSDIYSPMEKVAHSCKDPRSPSVGIDRTPITLPNNNTETETKKTSIPKEVPLDVQGKMNKLKYESGKEVISAAGDALLIYEDKDLEQPTTPQMKSTNSESRTPLSCVKNKTDLVHSRSKSINALISENSKAENNAFIKNTKKVSKIPRLQQMINNEKPFRSSSISVNKKSPIKQRSSWGHDNSVVL